METRLQFHVLCIIYTTCIVDTCFTADSVCPNRKSLLVDGNVVFYNETVCCDNYEMRTGQCVECDPGSFRPGDLKPEKCIPCTEGRYGKKCAFICTCHSNQSCNSITGCVLIHDAKDDHRDHRSSNDTWKQVSYGVAIGVVLIVICISICIMVVKKRNRISKAEINIPSVESLDMSLSNLASGAIALDRIGNCYDMYEEITESAIDAIQSESDSDSKEGSQIKPTEDAEGYLNPYHLFVHSPQERQYNTLKLLRSAQNN